MDESALQEKILVTKRCTKCGEEKPATSEYFARNKNKPDGLKSECKACYRAYYVANAERIKARSRAYGVANSARVVERVRVWNAKNPERRTEHHRRWYVKNRERVREYGKARWKAYYAANRERMKERSRAWAAAHPERVRECRRAWVMANSERIREYKRAYYATRGERVRTRNRLRATRKRGAEGSHTATDIRIQYENQKGKCYYCGEFTGKKYSVDHVIPLSRGGSNDPSNLVIACPSCNSAKKDRLPHEWPEGGRLL